MRRRRVRGDWGWEVGVSGGRTAAASNLSMDFRVVIRRPCPRTSRLTIPLHPPRRIWNAEGTAGPCASSAASAPPGACPEKKLRGNEASSWNALAASR